jgi:type I restriction enzyme S subunit
MIDGLRPYPETKPSGLPWLGDLPAHWDVRRNGRLFGSRRETGFPDLPVLEVSLRSGVRVRDFDNGMRKQEMGDRSKYQRAGRGDIAYNMMRMWQGAVGIAPVDGLVSPAYVVARPFAETDAAYYAYVFRTAAYMREVDTFSRGIVPDRNRLYWESFKQMPSVCPPLDEQRLIVRFLDWHGAQTAKLIRAKKKIIALLNEQKQAIIHRAVTRGLDQNAKLKPSGIPWLGDVPEGWEVKKLKYLVRFNNGLAFKPSDWSNSGAPIIRIQNLNGSEIFNYTTKVDLPEELLIKKGDILFSWSGNVGTSFGPFVWNRDFSGYLNQHIFKVEKIGSNRRYFYYVLKAVTKHVEENTHGIIGLVHITKPELGSISVPVAPFEEQVAIAGWLDNRLVGVNAVIDRAQREIALIEEFRTRLIADVVTGKLDVRAAAASLPEVTEPEPIDDLGEVDDLEEAIDATENEEVAA